jgi:aspartate carbamoyltransferase catalytic subunit
MHLLSVDNLTNEDIALYLHEAHNIKQNTHLYTEELRNYTLTNLFYESSTRTNLSFQKAMINLGGNVLLLNLNESSMQKGETVEDTIKTVSMYSDVIVIRSPQINFFTNIHSSVPIINAGDGSGEHPTQALLDLFTIQEELHRINDLKIGFVGDNENSRTVHSLVKLLQRFANNHVFMINDIKSFEKLIGEIDVLYVTRHQKERSQCKNYEHIIVNTDVIQNAKENMIIMHPLPRNDELSIELDSDKRSVYFKQVQNGVYMRMAILKNICNNK